MTIVCFSDVNECKMDSENDCTQMCTNTEGSYECSCISGYSKMGTNCIGTYTPIESCRHFVDSVLKCVFINENHSIFIQI